MAKKSIQLKDAVEGYIVRCQTKGYSNRTLEWYEQKLRCFCTYMLEQQGIKDLKAVTLFHIRAFVLYVQGIQSRKKKKISDLTVKGYVQVVKGFFSWCINEELLKDNPALKLERPKVGDYVIATFTQEEIKILLAVCDLKTERGYRDYTIMLLLLDTGIRVSELCGLYLQDIHRDHIRVLGKGRKEREVGVHPDTVKHIWKYVHKFRNSSDENEQRVFINRQGEPLTRSGVARLISDAGKKAGIADVRVSAHTFRHTFARMYLENGGDVYKLSRLMGHSEVQITETYLKDFQSREARRDYEQFSPVASIRATKKEKQKRSGSLFS